MVTIEEINEQIKSLEGQRDRLDQKMKDRILTVGECAEVADKRKEIEAQLTMLAWVLEGPHVVASPRQVEVNGEFGTMTLCEVIAKLAACPGPLEPVFGWDEEEAEAYLIRGIYVGTENQIILEIKEQQSHYMDVERAKK